MRTIIAKSVSGFTKEYCNKDGDIVVIEGKGWSTFRIFDEGKNLVFEVFAGRKSLVFYSYTFDKSRAISKVFSDSVTYYPTYQI